MNNRQTNAYIEELNELCPSYESKAWIIGGKNRREIYYPDGYGEAIRQHDPIAFNVGINEWERENGYV